MGFDLAELLAARRGEGYGLHARYGNPQLARMLRTIGFDTVYEQAEGAFLVGADGQRYLDFLSGFGVFGLGRNHPVVRQALHQYLDAQVADLVQFDCALLAGLLAERLVGKAPGMDRAYFANSGTEAVETALKFARCATGKPRVLYADHAFHGLTAGSLSVNGAREFRAGFGPLLPGGSVAFGDLGALAAELRKGDVAAFIVEPIQGKGVFLPPDGYLREAQELLRKHKALLICDEVQTGLGRTGDFFAYQAEGLEPDLVTVAKTLSGGFVPVGATLGKEWIFQKVYSSMDRVLVHDSTFGSMAMAMTAALATLSVLDDEDLTANAARTGDQLLTGLKEMAGQYEMLADVRGRGLMIGIEFGKASSLRLKAGWSMLQAARKGLFSQMIVMTLYRRHRILTQVSGDYLEVVKLLPPLTIGEREVEEFLAAFADVMEDAHKGTGMMWDFGKTLVKQARSS
ncbi:aspartate aminotransferase family protein [Catenulispora pinisilvae]|uniref:aspartate aminotransferase family protein n=1 Tax=Catenulispora pinisilvae TaxID=2705253 RepID=UPI0018912437